MWAKSNNRTLGQFVCDVTWFYFCLISLCSHARCGCFSMVCWGGWRKVGGGGGCLKLDVQGQEGGKILDADEQGVWGLEN